MFILKYKHNLSTPAMGKTMEHEDDILSIDIDIIKNELSANQYKHSIFPTDEIFANDQPKALDTEIRLIISLCKRNDLTILRSKNKPSDVSIYSSPLTMKPILSTTRDSLKDTDVVIITNINSRKQISALSDVSSMYKSVYLVKPKLSSPIDPNVYALLLDKDSNDNTRKSMLIHNLPDIVDMGLIVYEYMNYCVNLARSVADDNEFKTNYVKIPNISLPFEKEYEFYIGELIEYYKFIKSFM